MGCICRAEQGGSIHGAERACRHGVPRVKARRCGLLLVRARQCSLPLVRACRHSLPLVRWLLGECLYFVISRKPEDGFWFSSQHFYKCHKVRALERFLPVGFLFPKSFKWSQWFPVLSTRPQSRWSHTGDSASSCEDVSSADIVVQEAKCPCAGFLKALLKDVMNWCWEHQLPYSETS